MPSVVVVGGGIFGSALADRLVGDGWDVTLVDAFEPGDPRTESGGDTRMLRYSHERIAFTQNSRIDRSRSGASWAPGSSSRPAPSGSATTTAAGRATAVDLEAAGIPSSA